MMIEEVKFILAEMRKYKDPVDDLIEVSHDKTDNFNELIQLSNQKNSGFHIKGDAGQFVISCKPDILLVIFWITFIFYVPVRSILENSIDISGLVIMYILLAMMLIYFRFGPTTYDIDVNSYQKNLVLKSNNLFGRFLKPTQVIDFVDVEDFSRKDVYTNLKGLNNNYKKVLIHFKGRKLSLIYLPGEIEGTVNYKVFVSNLKNIISK